MAVNGMNEPRPVGCDENKTCNSTGAVGDSLDCRECVDWLNGNTESTYRLNSKCESLDPMISYVQCRYWVEKTGD
ncbi:hypothetical protein KKA47_01390 [bacterium]|nr:hypothetical protein [bacterium]